MTAAALALGTAGAALVALNAPDAESTATAGSEMDGNLLVLDGAGYVVWSRRTAQPTEAGPEDSTGRTAWQFVGAILAVSPFVLGSWWTGGSRVRRIGARPRGSTEILLRFGGYSDPNATRSGRRILQDR